MRHRQKGRKLGRNPSHRRAMLRNMASSLFLSMRPDELNEAGFEYDEQQDTPAMGLNRPKQKGRLITTLQKAKQVRPLVEKCVTIACKGLQAEESAEQYATSAARNSSDWKSWRGSDQWNQWNQAMAPSVNARRRVLQMLGNKNRFAVEVLFDEIAPQFLERPGGYTRIVRIASVRLGDAGTQAILEFVGSHDRVKQQSERPAFADDDEPATEDETVAEEEVTEEAAADDDAAEEGAEEKA